MPDQATLTARYAGLKDIADILKDQHVRKLDVVAPATAIRASNGLIRIAGAEEELSDEGVTTVDGTYRPTDGFDDGVAEKLKIPRKYLRLMRDQGRLDLYDHNLNGWLQGVADDGNPGWFTHKPDDRSFLLRLFRGGGGEVGVARALLSRSFRLTMDNLDVLTGALQGIQASGIDAHVEFANLSERIMHVRVAAPGVQVMAPLLLANYRNPFADPDIKRAGGWSLNQARRAAEREGQGYPMGDEPILFAGFDITNSETGNGAFNLTPVITVGPCGNGLRITVDALRKMHLGGRMDEGVIEYSSQTQRKALELVASQASDAARTFCSADYVQRIVSEMEEKAGVKIKSAESAEVVEKVSRALSFSDDERASVLQHFIVGGQITAGGVMQAVSSMAQTIDDPDRALEVESKAVEALVLAAAQ